MNMTKTASLKKGLWALALVLVLVSIGLTITACGNRQGSRNNVLASSQGASGGYAEKLYQYKGTYTGDNSKVSALVHTLDYIDLSVKSIELKTDNEPYGITVNYEVDSRGNYRFPDHITTGWNKNAAVMFSLIPNAGEISFRLYDPYGDFAGAYYNRDNLSERFGMEYFTAGTVKEAAGSLASFTNYLDKVSAIKNTEEFYSEGQKQNSEKDKQVYSVIGDDREITLNSGMGFLVTISDKFAANPPIKELAGQKAILAQYTGQKIEFLIYQIRNFKTNDAAFYLFAFDGVKMIAYADLKTAKARQDAVGILNALQGEGQSDTASTPAYFGTWIIQKEVPTPNVNSLSLEQINGYLGQKITVGAKQIVTGQGTIKNPVYKQTVLTNDDMYVNWRIRLSDLGVTDDTVTEIDVANYRHETENGLGAGFILTEDNRLYTNIGGVFFELGKG